MGNRSLDDFLGDDAADEATDDESDDASVSDAVDSVVDDAGDESAESEADETPKSDADEEPGAPAGEGRAATPAVPTDEVDPAVSTYVGRSGECATCGQTVEWRWQSEDGPVCPTCKSW